MALSGSAAIILLAALAAASLARGAQGVKDVVLVHGSWADASSWSDVIGRLQATGYTVYAPQLPLDSLVGDAQVVRQAIAAVGRPVVVAAHSYGGAVASVATAGLEKNVTALVFCSAYALDQGESLLGLNGRFAPAPALQYLTFNAAGRASLTPDGFVKTFTTPGVPLARARVLAVVQKAASLATFGTNATAVGWKTIPSYFFLSTKDQVVNPDLQAFEAARMKSRVVRVATGHASPISRSRDVANLIIRAAKASGGAGKRMQRRRLRLLR